jgi:glucose-fructose oxidoreductase
MVEKKRRGRSKAASSRSKRPARRRAARAGARRVRFAVVGLGHIAQVAVLPAFRHARRLCSLAALVSDEPKKLRALGRKYGVRDLRSYSEYEPLLRSGSVDAVYIALPNDQHRAYAIAAAEAGVHVLCEKPLGVTPAECRAMIQAAESNGVQLMTAYRLHFERASTKAIELVRSGRLGTARFFHALFGMQVRDQGNIRLDAGHGGGPLHDLGVYCINAARHLFGDEPEEVFAVHANDGQARFPEVPEMTAALLRFPGDRLASFTCSFGSSDVSTYRLVGTKGWLEVEPAFDYSQALELRVTLGKRTKRTLYPRRDQFAPELLHLAECILAGREPGPSGREGLADVRIVAALLESARKGRPVGLRDFESDSRPTLADARFLPPVAEPQEISASGPREH